MGITRRFAGGSGAAAADVSSQKYQQMALALAEKELEIGKLKEERSEYKRKYEDLTSTLKALADGGGHGAPPPAAATAASGARAQDKTDKEDGLQDKNFPLKVHRRQGKPVVADSYGKIHEKVEDAHARHLRMRREAYHRDKSIRAALTAESTSRLPWQSCRQCGARRTDDSSGSRPPLAAIGGGDDAAGARRTDDSSGSEPPEPARAAALALALPLAAHAADGARRTDDSSGASCARAQGSAGGQSSSASGAAAAEAEAAALEAKAAAAEAEAEAAEAEAAEAEAEDTAPEEPPSKKSKKTFIRKE